MDDTFSAIDDSCATFIHDAYPPAPPSSAAIGADPDPVTFEYGRQPGCWTVAGTALGSGIDDCVPTVIQLPHHHEVPGGEAAPVHVLSEGALQQLQRVTEKEGKQDQAAAPIEKRAQEQDKAAVAATEPAKAASVARAKQSSPGLNLPKSGVAGLKIVSKDGTKEFVIRPFSVNQPANGAANSASGQNKDKQPSAAAAHDAVPKAPSKAPTHAQNPPNPTSGMRQVKIVGKNGEEAFVELPFFTNGQKMVSKAPVPKKETNTPMAPAVERGSQAEKVASKDEKAEQDKKAAEMARQLRVEREQQEKDRKEHEGLREDQIQRQEKEKQEQKKKQQQHAVAAAAMSGALPGSRKPSPATKPISIHSSKGASSRSPSVLNGIFDDASKPPSKVSSRTNTPPPARVTSVKAASHVSSQQAKTVSIAGWQSVGMGKVRSQKDAYEGAWQDGAVDAAPTAWASKQGSEKAASLIYVGSKKARSPHSGHRANASPLPKWQDGAVSQARADSVLRRGGGKAAPHSSGHRQHSFSAADWQDLGSAIIQPAQPPSRPPSQANDPWHGADAIYKTPPSAPNRPPPQPQPQPQRKKASTPPSRPVTITSSDVAGKIAGINKWNNATPGTPSPPASLLQQHQRPSPIPPPIDTRRANNVSQDTIFAGTGWISPHPLSEPPSEFAVEPQEAISVGNGRMMTFAEWRVLQQEHRSFVGIRGGATEAIGRNNWSRTSSDWRSRQGGQWAETQRSPPGSLFGGLGEDAQLSGTERPPPASLIGGQRAETERLPPGNLIGGMGQDAQLASAERSPPASLIGGQHRSFGGGHVASSYRVPTVVSERYEPTSSQYRSSSRSISQPSEFRAQRVPSSTHSWGQTEQFAAPNAQQSFDDSLPPVGYWGTAPKSNGAGSERVGLGLEALIKEDGRSWRDMERAGSPMAVGGTNGRYAAGGGASSREGRSVQLPMPWD